ncbi:MAG: hypothetical protein R3B47_07395 [Bacteroidia bacterium]
MSTNPLSGLFPSFVGSSTVLNDGSSTNVLTLALTNSNMHEGTSEEVNISITSETELGFYFIADGNEDAGKKKIKGDTFKLNWALASKANIDGIVPHLFLPGESIDYASLSNQQRIPAGWKINSNTPNITLAALSTLQGWTISPPSGGYTLKPGQSLLLVFTNIISDLPDGPSLAYMAYEKRHFIKCGPLQKTPNVISGDKVGIGTTNPQYPLSIRAMVGGPKISLWDAGNNDKMHGFGISSNQLNYTVFDVESDHVFYGGGNNDTGAELLRIKGNGETILKNNMTVDGGATVNKDLFVNNGKVGIGTTGPLYPLSISPGSMVPKISLWDNGDKNNMHGFGVSPYQLNYHIQDVASSHVFYATGKNGDGTELMRIKGSGEATISKSLTVGDLTVHNATVHWNLKVPGELAMGKKITIQNEAPIIVKQFGGLGNPSNTDTGIDFQKYYAIVNQYAVHNYDVDEKGRFDWMVMLQKSEKTNNWEIFVNMPYDPPNPGSWIVWVMAFHRNLLGNRGFDEHGNSI